MTLRFAKLLALVCTLLLHLANTRAGNPLNAVYDSATDVPQISANGYDTNGLAVNFTLNFAPPAGTNLTVVKVLNPSSQVNGTFSNLAQNQAVSLSYGGQVYRFVANYFGGTGNDLVLQWANNRAMAWGANTSGQLGTGGTATSNQPVPVTASGVLAGKTILALAPGYAHTLALCADGTLAAWGSNSDGQLGNTGGTSTVPVLVTFPGALSTKRVIAITAGAYHSLALCSDGTVVAWGANGSGQLGTGSAASSSPTPTAVSASSGDVLFNKKVVALAAGKYFSMALLSTGAVVTWGENTAGQLGNNHQPTPSNVPVAVSTSGILGSTTAVAIAAGQTHCLALCANGALAAWGGNSDGQFGNNTTNPASTPQPVPINGTALAAKTVTAIAAGGYHSLALCSDGTVAAWGQTNYGQLGTTGGSHLLPVAVDTGGALANKTVTAIAGGYSHTFALCSDGTLTAWGFNGNGELGIGNISAGSAVPVAVLTSTLGTSERFTMPAAGPNAIHSPAIVASPAPISASNLTAGTLLSNGSFENGFTSWTPSDISNPFNALAVRPSGYSPGLGLFNSAPTDGGLAATSGFEGVGPGKVRLAHDVTVTAAEPFVRFDYRAGWNLLDYGPSIQARTFAVTIEPAGGGTALQSTVILSAAAQTKLLDTGALSGAVDLTAFIGTTVRVSFDLTIPENHTGPAFFQLDNVRTAALSLISRLTAGALISNGGFESGTFSNWTVSDINAAASTLGVVTSDFNAGYGLFSLAATEGTRIAKSGFGGTGPSVIRLAHEVSVISAAPFVRFDWRAGWNMLDYPASTLPRTFTVNIEPSGGGPVLQSSVILSAAPHTKNLDTGSQTAAVDLSAFIGMTVRICFDLTVPEGAFAPALFQLDNVRTAALLPASTYPITRAATVTTIEGATLNATVNANGLATTVEFEYGLTMAYGGVITDAQSPYSGNADTAASAPVFGLSENTTYHYRVKTTNSAGIRYGIDTTFTTLPHAPTITDSGYSFVTNSSATFYATVEPYGASTTVTFEYGTTTAYGSSTSAWEGPVTAVHSGVHGQISGLTGGTTYYWRVKAENAGGVNYANSTYTPDPAEPGTPAVNTLTPTMVNRSSVTLNGVVNGRGATSTVDFEFGTTTNYGPPVSAFPSSVSGTKDTPIAGTRGNLSPGTTYHYRTRAFAPGNYFVYGPGMTFTTPAIGFPAASTAETTDITQTTALLHGFFSANNGPATTVSFDYGLDTYYGDAVTLPGPYTGPSFTSVLMQIPTIGNSVTYHYRIKATNNIGTTYGQDMTFITPDSHEARLYDLSFSTGTLSQPFNRDLLSYTMNLSFESASLSLTPTASAGIGSVSVNGDPVQSGATSSPTVLTIGDHVFKITVTSLDGLTQQTYTVTVSRPAPVAGNLDLSFGDTGLVLADFAASTDHAYAVAVQSDGRIVVVGSAYHVTDPDFAVARFNPDGTPDLTFGGVTGKVMTDFTAGSDTASGVALQSDGKIIVVGAVGNGTNSDFGVARYNPDGTLDTTFGGTGKVITPFTADGSSASGVAVQADGKIVVAGTARNPVDNDFALVRYHGNIATGTPGTLDLTFNGTGKVTTSLGGDDTSSSMALQGDGKIVVAGSSNIGGNVECSLARYESDGTPDLTFNGTGQVVLDLGASDDGFRSVAVQADGKIVAAGYAHVGLKSDFAVVRYHGDLATGAPGTLDTDFNGTGKIIAPITTGDDTGTGVVLQSDGKIVVGGYFNNAGAAGFAVARYTTAGLPDNTFHGTGAATRDFGIGSGYAIGTALQSDGKILLAGYDDIPGLSFGDFALVRFLGDGAAIAVQTPPATGVFDGISTVQFPGALPGASVSLPLTIQDTGTDHLTGLDVTIDGADSSAFTVTASPAAPVAAFGSTSFTVRFLPATLGPKTAALHIASNVTGSTQSYDIALKGTGLTVLENWRQQFLGTWTNLGDAADNADPYHTGIPNLAAYALFGLNQNPALLTTAQLPQPNFAGGNYVISFAEPAGVTGVTYGAQWCADLAIGDWQPMTDSPSGTTHRFSVPIGTNTQIFTRLKVTSP